MFNQKKPELYHWVPKPRNLLPGRQKVQGKFNKHILMCFFIQLSIFHDCVCCLVTPFFNFCCDATKSILRWISDNTELTSKRFWIIENLIANQNFPKLSGTFHASRYLLLFWMIFGDLKCLVTLSVMTLHSCLLWCFPNSMAFHNKTLRRTVV